MKYPIAVFIIVAIIFLISCDNKHIQLEILSKEICRYGDVEGGGKGIVGNANDFIKDINGNVYVLDGAFKKVIKYSNKGIYLKEYGKGEGPGPGEFYDPRSIDIDSLGNIYIADMLKRNITVLDSLNNVVKIVKLNMMPARIVVTKPFHVYVLGFPFSYKGDLIHKYVLTNDGLEIPSQTFCKRITGKDSLAIEKSGNIGSFIKGKNGSLYYGSPYPNEIRKFSESGELLSKFIFNPSNEYEPKINKNTNGIIVDMNMIFRDISFLNDSTMIRQVLIRNNDVFKTSIDVIDTHSNRYIGTIENGLIELDKSTTIKGDGMNNIFVYYREPVPIIKKYNIHIKR